MISLDAARALIARTVQALDPVRLPLREARGRVLREDVAAPEDLPAFDRSAMDGYAVGRDDRSERFRVVAEIQPGAGVAVKIGPGECARIFTGAAIPVSTGSAPPSVAALPEEAGAPPVIAPAPRRVSTPAAKRREEPVESDAPHFGPFAATVDSVTANSATFHWQDDVPAGTEYRCLQRTLSVDEDGELVPAFHDYTACKFAKRDGANTATVEKLEPGKSYLFRIDAGSSAVTFAQIRTPSPPVSEHRISLVYVLFTLAVIAGGISIWQRVRPRSGF